MARKKEEGDTAHGIGKVTYHPMIKTAGEIPPLDKKDVNPRILDFGHTDAVWKAVSSMAAEIVLKMRVPEPGETTKGEGTLTLVPPAIETHRRKHFTDALEAETDMTFTVEAEDVFLFCATAHRIPWVRAYLRETLNVNLPAGFGDIPLELHSLKRLAKAHPKNKEVKAAAASGEWAYVLLVNYPKLGPVCGLGYRRPPAPEDFEGRKVAPGAEWASLPALAARGCAIQATDADTLRILRRLLKGKALRELIREPSAKRYRYPGSLSPLQRTLTHGPGTPADIDRSPSGQRVARLTYSDKLNTQLVLDETRTSLEDVNAYVARTVRELGPLCLKVWHAALCFAAEDMMHELDGGSFWWSPDRMLQLEGMTFRHDNRENRQEKLRLLHEDVWHEVHRAGGGGETVTIKGHLITSIEPDTTCTLEVPGRRVQWYRVILHPSIGNEVREARRKGRFALLDKKWFRLDPREHPIALCLYPFLEDQWRRNTKAVWAGKRERWLGLSIENLAEAAGLDIDVSNPKRTRENITANLDKLEAMGLIGGWKCAEGETVLEDILEAWPPEDHEGIAGLHEWYEKTRPKALPGASSETVC